MPIYEYLCEACGTLSERLQKVTDPPPRKCPECGSRKIARLVSRTSFQLKGGGWYADLYATPRADGAAKGAAKAGGGAPKDGAEKKTGEGAAAPSEAAAPAPARPSGSGE